jgi:hypothetical protein
MNVLFPVVTLHGPRALSEDWQDEKKILLNTFHFKFAENPGIENTYENPITRS